MAQLLLHFTFDNSNRFSEQGQMFEYEGVRFKLVQSDDPRRHSDALLTLAPFPKDGGAQEQAFRATSDFLSALAWVTQARVTFEFAGGFGVPDDFPLEQAECRVFTFPQLPFGGNVTGYSIDSIALVENETQRTALALYREARSSNKIWLSFLFYWQVLELAGGNAPEWINKALRKGRIEVTKTQLRILELGGRKLGDVLQEECRHAIAHIRRKPGRRALRFDTFADQQRVGAGAGIVEECARVFIRDTLGLTKKMYRAPTGTFPPYLPEVP